MKSDEEFNADIKALFEMVLDSVDTLGWDESEIIHFFSVGLSMCAEIIHRNVSVEYEGGTIVQVFNDNWIDLEEDGIIVPTEEDEMDKLATVSIIPTTIQ